MEKNKNWTLGLVAAGALSLSFIASADDAKAFRSLVLDKNAPTTVRDKSKVEITQEQLAQNGEPVTVIKAANEQDAVNAAVQHMRKARSHAALISVDSGLGVVVLGSAHYRELPNRNASQIIKHLAANRSYHEAMGELAEFLHGLNNKGKNRLANAIDTFDDANDTLANVDTIAQENIKQKVSGMVSGFAVYSVNDDVKNHAWEVVLVSTPRTRGESLRVSSGLIVAEDVAAGMDHVFAELSTGIVPPAGGRVITVPKTGQAVFIGFGSAVKRINPNPAVERELAKMAGKVSRMRAADNLCAMIVGKAFAWRRGMTTQTHDANLQFTEVTKDDPQTRNNIETVVEPVAETLGTFKATMSVREEFVSASEGSLPAGVLSFSIETGDWVYHGYIYSTEVSAMADKARKKMLEKSIQERGEEQKRTLRVLDNRFRGRLQYGDRNVTPTRDRDAFGNERPLERQPSGPVTPKKDL